VQTDRQLKVELDFSKRAGYHRANLEGKTSCESTEPTLSA
jgi:hypothetical protein